MHAFTFFTILFLIIVIALFVTWFFSYKAKNDERRLLLEKGVDYGELPDELKVNFQFPWLKVGVVTISICIGLMVGIVFHETRIYSDPSFPIILMFFFGGIGMIVAHYIDKPNHKS